MSDPPGGIPGAVSSSSASAAATSSSSTNGITPWEPPKFAASPHNASKEELRSLGYSDSLDDHSGCFRPWDPTRFEGWSKLYTEAWNKWPPSVRQTQCLASDGKPYTDNPVPAMTDDCVVCENQDMTSAALYTRVLGRSHIVVFRKKTIIMDGTSRQEETDHEEGVATWPQRRQTLMAHVADTNYYGEEGSEEWSYATTVISSSVRGDTFMSPMHTNPLKPGHKDPGLVHWISTRGSVVDDLATTKVQTARIAKFGTKVLSARHGPHASGEDGPSELVLLGDYFNDEMLQLLDQFKNTYSTSKRIAGDHVHTIKVPRLFRLIVVNPNGFTNDMKDRLFGKGKVFEGRVPVRQFTNLENNVLEMEVVVFPVAFSTFWEDPDLDTYTHYTDDLDTIRAAYSNKLSADIGMLMHKRYANPDLKSFVGRIHGQIMRAAAEKRSAAASESHNDQESGSAAVQDKQALQRNVLKKKQALQRNLLKKSDLDECGEKTVAVKLFEIGLCTYISCKYAGPAGFDCACGRGFFKPHVRGVPEGKIRFPNKFLDSSSDESSSDESSSDESSSSSSEDDSHIKKRKLSAAKSAKKVKKPKKPVNEEVETLKQQFFEKFRHVPKGRYASDVAWLKKKLE